MLSPLNGSPEMSPSYNVNHNGIKMSHFNILILTDDRGIPSDVGSSPSSFIFLPNATNSTINLKED